MISFRSKITKKLLGYFFLHQEEERYVNELARMLEIDPKNLDRKLKELEKVGLFQSEQRGRERYYGLNQSFPLVKEYKRMFQSTFGMEGILRWELSKFHDVEQAFLFGSYANDQLATNSDIDLLVVGNHKALDLQRVLSKLQKGFQREINCIDMTPSEFQQKKKKKDPFLMHVFSQPVISLKS